MANARNFEMGTTLTGNLQYCVLRYFCKMQLFCLNYLVKREIRCLQCKIFFSFRFYGDNYRTIVKLVTEMHHGIHLPVFYETFFFLLHFVVISAKFDVCTICCSQN